MNKVTLIIKVITWSVVLTFTTTTIGLSAPSFQTTDHRLQTTDEKIQQAMAEQYTPAKPHDTENTMPMANGAIAGAQQGRDVHDTPVAGDTKTPLAWQISIPHEYGDVTARWLGQNGPSKAQSAESIAERHALSTMRYAAPTVAIIQDAHCNYEAHY